MQDWFVLAFFFIVVGIPVIVSALSKAHKQQMQFKARQLELMSSDTAEKAAQYAAHTERLEQRVRVLERIVTDKGILVSDEIEKLRNEPLN